MLIALDHDPGAKYPYTTAMVYFFAVPFQIEIPGFVVPVDGGIAVLPGYSWDGASGPAIDTITFVRASLIHDVLYQALREGSTEVTRAEADAVLYHEAMRCGMHPVRAWYCWAAVRLFGARFARGDRARG